LKTCPSYSILAFKLSDVALARATLIRAVSKKGG
jgi:hypothetical protein